MKTQLAFRVNDVATRFCAALFSTANIASVAPQPLEIHEIFTLL